MADPAAAGGPPPELIPGFYDDRSGLVIFCVVFCLVVSTIMVGLRLWTRAFILKKVGADDWAAAIALVLTWGAGISVAVCTKYGLGRHIFAIQPPSLIGLYWKTFWTTLLFYHAGLCGAKMTFLLQYYRLFSLQRMRIAYIIAIIVVGAWSFAQVLITLLICRPIQGFWDLTVEAKCMPTSPQIYVNAGGNIITDIAIFVLPLPALSQMTMQKRQKLILLGIFSLGFFTVAISVIRIKYLNINADITWQHVESTGWSVGELASALTCSSLPTLRPFVSKYFPSMGLKPTQSKLTPSHIPTTIGGGGAGPRGKGGAVGPEDSFVEKIEHELRMPSSGQSTDDNNSRTRTTAHDEEILLGSDGAKKA